MSAKYTVTTTDITVTIRERGVSGTLTFGVGGPIAAKTVADLAEEVNGLETELAALRRVAEAARAAHLPNHVLTFNELCELYAEIRNAVREYDKCRAA